MPDNERMQKVSKVVKSMKGLMDELEGLVPEQSEESKKEPESKPQGKSMDENKKKMIVAMLKRKA